MTGPVLLCLTATGGSLTALGVNNLGSLAAGVNNLGSLTAAGVNNGKDFATGNSNTAAGSNGGLNGTTTAKISQPETPNKFQNRARPQNPCCGLRLARVPVFTSVKAVCVRKPASEPLDHLQQYQRSRRRKLLPHTTTDTTGKIVEAPNKLFLWPNQGPNAYCMLYTVNRVYNVYCCVLHTDSSGSPSPAHGIDIRPSEWSIEQTGLKRASLSILYIVYCCALYTFEDCLPKTIRSSERE